MAALMEHSLAIGNMERLHYRACSMRGPRWICCSFLAAWLPIALFSLLNGACSDSTETPTDAGAEAETGLSTDPFCRGRPLLPFCEDFDEKPLPGAFAELSSDQSIEVK